MKWGFITTFVMLVLSILVSIGCFPGGDNPTSRRSSPSGEKNQAQEKQPLEELLQEPVLEEPLAALDPVEVATTELAAAESSLAEFDSANPRPEPKIGPVRAWFAREGTHNFYGRAIDFTGEVVTLQSYDDERTVEVPIEKLRDEHRSHIAEGFGDYLIAVNDWKKIRQPHEELVSVRRKTLDDALAAMSAKEAALEAERIAEVNRAERVMREQNLERQSKSRDDAIEKCFSFWDGSHIGLTKYIKEQMHNPNSYEHVSTKYIDKGNHLIIIMTFRGTNIVGAVVTNTVEAEVDLTGKVLDITSGDL